MERGGNLATEVRSKVKRFLVLAAAGSGMNVLIQHLLSEGHIVWGMDRLFDQKSDHDLKRTLERLGARIISENTNLQELNLDIILTSPAVESDHKALVQAATLDLPVQKRSEFLTELFNQKKGIGIAGTSGKTTVTGMVATILKNSEQDPTVFCGDVINNFKSRDVPGNYLPGQGNSLILELDESEKSGFRFCPQILGINNIQKDHHEISELMKLFSALLNQSEQTVINIDCPQCQNLISGFDGEIITVSIKDETADFFARIIKIWPDRLDFTINGVQGSLMVPGAFNVVNAVMAVGLACQEGLEIDQAMRALMEFKGIRNRFEVYRSGSFNVILDFAHNPDKIRMCIRSARHFDYPLKFIFQPHGYNPYRFMLTDLARVLMEEFTPEDELILLKIYDAGGTTDRSVQSPALFPHIKGLKTVYAETREAVLNLADHYGRSGFSWIVAGARDHTLRDLFLSLSKD